MVRWLLPLASAQLHFASIGNWGAGNAQQRAVAQTLKAAARSPPLSFVVSPGSNFMGSVIDLEDRNWNDRFHDMYGGEELHLPWFVALGEEDWRGNVTAMVLKSNNTYGQTFFKKTENDDMKMTKGPRWTLPNFFYHYTQTFTDISASNSILSAPEVSVFLVFIDTMILNQGFSVPSQSERHWEELRASLEAASKSHDWIIVVGDDAMYSSGKSRGNGYLRSHLRELLRSNLVDAYIAGRDKNMEFIEDGSLAHIMCGSGSGGKYGNLFSHDGSIFWSNRPGFCLHTLTKNNLDTRFIDGLSGKQLFSYNKTKNIKNTVKTDKLKFLKAIPKVRYQPLPAGIGGSPGGAIARIPNHLFVLLCGSLGLGIFAGVLVSGAMVAKHRIKEWTER